jgi:hypothetical protein
MESNQVTQEAAVPEAEVNNKKNDIFSSNEDSFDLSEKKVFNIGVFVCWVAATIAIGGSIFFWLLNNSTLSALADKTSERDQIVSEIDSPSLANAGQKANLLKAAVSKYEQASSSRYLISDFLPFFYQKVGQSIVVKNVSISSDSQLSFDGLADSYRTVASQMVLLSEWEINDKNILKDVKLLSVSENVNETTKKVEVPFSISAVIVKNISLKEKVTINESQSSSATMESDVLTEEGSSDATTNE